MKKLIASVAMMMISSLLVNAQSSQMPKFWIALEPGAYFYSVSDEYYSIFQRRIRHGGAVNLGVRWIYMYRQTPHSVGTSLASLRLSYGL